MCKLKLEYRNSRNPIFENMEFGTSKFNNQHIDNEIRKFETRRIRTYQSLGESWKKLESGGTRGPAGGVTNGGELHSAALDTE